VGPDYHTPDTALPASWRGQDAADAASADDVALSRWWENLNDPQLTSLVEEAASGNLDLKLAWSKVRQAKAQRGVSRAAYSPSLSASASGTSSKSSEGSGSGQTSERYSTGLDASWELDLFGGTRRSVEAAQADLEASQESLRDVMVSMAAEVATNYVEMRTYQARLAAARRKPEVAGRDAGADRIALQDRPGVGPGRGKGPLRP
jgi:outer membrane protein TolC